LIGAGVLLLTACGGGSGAAPAGEATSPVGGSPASPASLPTVAAAPSGSTVFTIVPGQSRATFRVREQLVGVQLPSDAVGTTSAVTGRIVLRREGGIAPEASRVLVDLRDLRTDDPRRDSFIRQSTLRTADFPNAEFMPRTAPGLPNPLPASGEHTFRLSGGMLLRGVARDVTWDVTARRAGAQLSARATTTVRFGDFGMTPPRAEPVVMVVDEIRLELDLVAAQS
jgi:polyisoprenoid-binding protein YceI